MRESLYQYIVPLAFAAIWALTSLFNRETQTLPPRTGRPPGPNGPRPSSPGGTTATASPGRPAEWRPEPTYRESTAARPGGAGSAPSSNRSGGTSLGTGNGGGPRRKDEILVIEAEPKRAATSPKGGTQGGRRGAGSRSRVSNPPTTRSGETVTPRALSDSFARLPTPPTQLLPQVPSLSPLSLPPSPLLSNPENEAAKMQAGRALVQEQSAFSTLDIRTVMQNPGRLRESFIIGEMLRPPLSMRPGGLFARRRV